MSLEGSLLRMATETEEVTVNVGAHVDVPLKLFRSPKLPLPVKLELILEPEQVGLVQAQVLSVPPGQGTITFRITSSADAKLVGNQVLKIRGTAYEAPDRPVVSEIDLPVTYLKP